MRPSLARPSCACFLCASARSSSSPAAALRCLVSRAFFSSSLSLPSESSCLALLLFLSRYRRRPPATAMPSPAPLAPAGAEQGPAALATPRAVSPAGVFTSVAAPARTSAAMTARWPFTLAASSGLIPLSFFASLSARARSSTSANTDGPLHSPTAAVCTRSCPLSQDRRATHGEPAPLPPCRPSALLSAAAWPSAGFLTRSRPSSRDRRPTC
jgi:hypothetical protein